MPGDLRQTPRGGLDSHALTRREDPVEAPYGPLALVRYANLDAHVLSSLSLASLSNTSTIHPAARSFSGSAASVVSSVVASPLSNHPECSGVSNHRHMTPGLRTLISTRSPRSTSRQRIALRSRAPARRSCA